MKDESVQCTFIYEAAKNDAGDPLFRVGYAQNGEFAVIWQAPDGRMTTYTREAFERLGNAFLSAAQQVKPSEHLNS